MKNNAKVLSVAPTLYIKLHVDKVLTPDEKWQKALQGMEILSSVAVLLRATQSTLIHRPTVFLTVCQIRESRAFQAQILTRNPNPPLGEGSKVWWEEMSPEPDPLHPKPCPEQTMFFQKLLVSHQLSLSMNYLKLGKNSFPLQIFTPTDSFVVVQLPCRPLYLTHKTVRLTLTCCLVVRHEQNSDLSSS